MADAAGVAAGVIEALNAAIFAAIFADAVAALMRTLTIRVMPNEGQLNVCCLAKTADGLRTVHTMV